MFGLAGSTSFQLLVLRVSRFSNLLSKFKANIDYTQSTILTNDQNSSIVYDSKVPRYQKINSEDVFNIKKQQLWITTRTGL